MDFLKVIPDLEVIFNFQSFFLSYPLILYLIEVELIYNTVLVLGVQHSDSVLYICIYIYIYTHMSIYIQCIIFTYIVNIYFLKIIFHYRLL